MASEEVLASTADGAASTSRYSLLVTRDPDEVRAAQRLRHAVFVGEMGAVLHGPEAAEGIDTDHFDEFCDHLVVRQDDTGAIVGTYRMLSPAQAKLAGSLYSDTEFDLRNIDPIRAEVVETGRSCVHPDHRTGAVISLVWAGIGQYMARGGHRYLAGCASVPVTDGGAFAAGVWDTVAARHYAPEQWRVTPLHPWDVDAAPRPQRAVVPSLMRGYLRLGAQVCGRPALDADFGVADFFLLLGLDNVHERYLNFFLGKRR